MVANTTIFVRMHKELANAAISPEADCKMPMLLLKQIRVTAHTLIGQASWGQSREQTQVLSVFAKANMVRRYH
jgi:hypothetical protein